MADQFPNTRWSLVIEARGDCDAPTARRALDELCQTYWYPIYSYARRRGLTPEDAEDSTQDFFAGLLKRGVFGDLCPEKGRMRAFLLTAMRRFLSSQWRAQNTLKRGGGQTLISIDIEATESRFASGPVDTKDTPDLSFEKAWAHTLLGVVYEALEKHYLERGQEKLFVTVRPFLAWGESSQPHALVASQLGMNEASVRTAIHRMRARYRGLLEAEIRETVASQEEAIEELRFLKRVLSTP